MLPNRYAELNQVTIVAYERCEVEFRLESVHTNRTGLPPPPPPRQVRAKDFVYMNFMNPTGLSGVWQRFLLEFFATLPWSFRQSIIMSPSSDHADIRSELW